MFRPVSGLALSGQARVPNRITNRKKKTPTTSRKTMFPTLRNGLKNPPRPRATLPVARPAVRPDARTAGGLPRRWSPAGPGVRRWCWSEAERRPPAAALPCGRPRASRFPTPGRWSAVSYPIMMVSVAMGAGFCIQFDLPQLPSRRCGRKVIKSHAAPCAPSALAAAGGNP